MDEGGSPRRSSDMADANARLAALSPRTGCATTRRSSRTLSQLRDRSYFQFPFPSSDPHLTPRNPLTTASFELLDYKSHSRWLTLAREIPPTQSSSFLSSLSSP